MSVEADMMNLFEGATKAHGVFFPQRFEGKKHIGNASTVRQEVNEAKWSAHLAGDVGLGIIPINEQSECKWAVIDVDDYDLNWEELLHDIKDTPLVCCRSKSGGAHLFIFSREYIPARTIRNYLRNLVGNLGLGNSEIFPKQDHIYSERGDVGNWLNMPYFGKLRVCVRGNSDIKELTVEEFLKYANEKRVGSKFFRQCTRDRLRRIANRIWSTMFTGDVNQGISSSY